MSPDIEKKKKVTRGSFMLFSTLTFCGEKKKKEIWVTSNIKCLHSDVQSVKGIPQSCCIHRSDTGKRKDGEAENIIPDRPRHWDQASMCFSTIFYKCKQVFAAKLIPKNGSSVNYGDFFFAKVAQLPVSETLRSDSDGCGSGWITGDLSTDQRQPPAGSPLFPYGWRTA